MDEIESFDKPMLERREVRRQSVSQLDLQITTTRMSINGPEAICHPVR